MTTFSDLPFEIQDIIFRINLFKDINNLESVDEISIKKRLWVVMGKSENMGGCVLSN